MKTVSHRDHRGAQRGAFIPSVPSAACGGYNSRGCALAVDWRTTRSGFDHDLFGELRLSAVRDALEQCSAASLPISRKRLFDGRGAPDSYRPRRECRRSRSPKHLRHVQRASRAAPRVAPMAETSLNVKSAVNGSRFSNSLFAAGNRFQATGSRLLQVGTSIQA